MLSGLLLFYLHTLCVPLSPRSLYLQSSYPVPPFNIHHSHTSQYVALWDVKKIYVDSPLSVILLNWVVNKYSNLILAVRDISDWWWNSNYDADYEKTSCLFLSSQCCRPKWRNHFSRVEKTGSLFMFLLSVHSVRLKKEFYNAFGFNTGSFLLTREAKAFLAKNK